MLLEGKVAVIHGGGGSIGSAAARVFAREGAQVFLAGRSLPRLEAAASSIRADRGSVEIAVVDAMDQAAVDDHVDAVVRAQGGIDVALNAVGFDHVQGLAIGDAALADYLHPITGYLQTNFVTAKAAARHMASQGSGVILTISTPGARLTGPGLIGNAAQSAGLEGFSRALAGELGPAGVRVVCVRPNALLDAIGTSYTGEMFGRIAALTATPRAEWLAGLAGNTLLDRLPLLDEVAEYLAFAASDRARSMTGVIANLTAGMIVD
ncbi:MULTISPECIES: SDR family NAD(P)-dependent oxidoreductase [unclassified Leifsonia]|uniref:SDR family NAD(P)-dependent oxidoreductase n=1 Tax=unclassified Leifsonia TaxID=2663824 RepID=UPI0006FE9945|nr:MULTISPECIES: SDR family oxidoreductase [unclassified Leifsonia]KQX05574.1 short-chain dehydrogenase [Leifsonia sp. Root1293]KRA09208.1 short-chain dehydrogenase [Leifsonia sp. Root60]